MKCLRCENTELQVKERGEGGDTFEIDVCSSCDGIWLDAKEMVKLDDNFFVDVEAIEYGDLSATAEDAALQCPHCAVAMNKVYPREHSSVVLDTCATCNGFWLDKGELEKMRSVSDRMLIAALLELDD